MDHFVTHPIAWLFGTAQIILILDNLLSIRFITWILFVQTGRQLPLGFSVGMSANQIGVPKRVFALHLPRE